MLNWGQDLVDNIEDKAECILASGRASPTASLQHFMCPDFGKASRQGRATKKKKKQTTQGEGMSGHTNGATRRQSEGNQLLFAALAERLRSGLICNFSELHMMMRGSYLGII